MAIKKLIFIIILLLPISTAFGADVTFEWDPNTETDLAGYRLYQSDTSGVYTYGDGNQVETIPAGTETVTLYGVPDGTWYWVLTAYDTSGNESGPSNEVTDTLDSTAPAPPTGLKKNIAF